ncbi:MAG: hypothetical protein IT572_07925 [Deltaproteobacteria bacterium]|nr:hypothetical protein [Deltaproteobacteria bacterium]
MIFSSRSLLRYLPLSLVWLCLACGSNPGVEVGNPKLGGQVVTISPVDRQDVYVVRFADDGGAEVTQVAEDVFESTAGEVSGSGAEVQVTAFFSDETDFEADFQVSDAGEILAVTLQLDGVPVEATFTVEFAKPTLKALWSNQALLTVATICRRVSECQPVTPATDCETDLKEVPGLAQSLGGAPGQSVGQMAESLEDGNVAADDAALSACLADIDILPCRQVDKGHDPLDPDDYNQGHRLVPKPSCARAFSQKK